MSDPADEKVMRLVVDASVRLGVLGLLFWYCLQVMAPFIMILLWSAILAVAVYPLYLKLLPLSGDRRGTLATIMVVLALAMLIVPVVQLSSSVIDTGLHIKDEVEAGTLAVPPPNESVKDWPLIGEGLYNSWSLANSSLEEAALQYRDQLTTMSERLIGVVGSIGYTLFVFLFATIFAGVFMANADASYSFTLRYMQRLSERRGQMLTELIVKTVRSIAQGVVGIALIQASLAGIGLVLAGVPFPGLWTLMVLVLAIAQLPPWLVLGPIMVWLFSEASTTTASVFMIYGLIVSFSDAFLKPLLLGRGMDIPMPVILMGAIGGLIHSGIVGLFVGAVVLALGYELFLQWLDPERDVSEPGASAGE